MLTRWHCEPSYLGLVVRLRLALCSFGHDLKGQLAHGSVAGARCNTVRPHYDPRQILVRG